MDKVLTFNEFVSRGDRYFELPKRTIENSPAPDKKFQKEYKSELKKELKNQLEIFGDETNNLSKQWHDCKDELQIIFQDSLINREIVTRCAQKMVKLLQKNQNEND